MKELIILKLGGSVITRKDENSPEINREILNRIAKEIAEAMSKRNFRLIIVHGAGAFGHVPAREYGLDKGVIGERQLQGFSITHQSMERLNYDVVEVLKTYGINAISFQPSAVGILKSAKLVYFPVRVIKELIKLDMVPVCYGDVLVDEDTGINILSGDHLVPYLARKLNADRVVIATDVDGVYDKNPKKNKDAKLIRKINRENIDTISEIGTSDSVDVTGGMKRKLDELLELTKFSIDSYIISALKVNTLKRTLLGEQELGTVIKK